MSKTTKTLADELREWVQAWTDVGGIHVPPDKDKLLPYRTLLLRAAAALEAKDEALTTILAMYEGRFPPTLKNGSRIGNIAMLALRAGEAP